MIHRTAIVDPNAQIDNDVEIGPYMLIPQYGTQPLRGRCNRARFPARHGCNWYDKAPLRLPIP
jgi:hypothetical protein